ncbi:MAG: TolC family protein [Anaerovorax sp.]
MKKLVSVILSAAMIFGCSSVAFAADQTTTQTAVNVNIPIKLSLDAAYKKVLADSPGAKMAVLNKKSAEAVSKGYSESVQDLNQLERASKAGEFVSYDPANKDMARANRDFATAQAENNYQSELNALKTSTFENYFKLKDMENQVILARENLALSQKLLSNTQLKLKVGTVSKNDVLKAEMSVTEAQDSLRKASNGLAAMRMGFNQFMGFNLMQVLSLTDTLKESPMPTKTLQASIGDALKNRNEIVSAKFDLDMATIYAKTYAAYPTNSAKYLNAQMGILLADTAYKNAPLTVEKDVRTAYAAVNDAYTSIQSSNKSVASAKEAVRLAQLQYDVGMGTLPDVSGAQLGLFKAQLAQSNALLEYSLAVDAYNLCSGVGTTPARIK